MSGESFRFLHAAGFRLHEPLRGFTEVSAEFLELVTEAPHASAAAVFSTALREEVDFVALSGDLLDPTSSGPASITFLHQQFSRLAERNIAVYWSASQSDQTGNWLGSIEWPENVSLFSKDSVERIVHCRGDLPVAEILGRSWNGQRPMRAADFLSEPIEHFRLAVVPSQLDWQSEREGVRYWGCGGSNSAITPREGSSFVHCPGSTQGLTPTESGAHGCTLVHADADGSVRTRMIPTDAVRWCHERVQVSFGMSRQETRRLLKSRVKHLAAEISRPMLVVWTITGESRFDSLLVQADDREEILNWLRDEYSDATPPLWSVALELEPPDGLPPQWCEEDSILGDYLRVVQKYEAERETLLGLQDELPGDPPPELREALKLADQGHRDQVLREAALLGADLLRGDEAPER